MADNQKTTAQELQEGAKNVKNAAKLAKDVGRIAVGDATAVKDLLANELVQQILMYSLLMVMILSLVIGSAITGVLEHITTSWQENWEENWTDQAVQSNGDLLYLNTAGVLFNIDATIIDVITGLFTNMANQGIANAGDSDNHQIGNQEILDAGRNPEASDYDTTMKAIMENAMLNKALTDRLEMIKGRVRQRGLQIQHAVQMQYISGRGSDLNKIAEIISDEMEESYITEDGTIVFYAGYNEDLSFESIEFDNSTFQLTDLQALKILAIFSIQHDCQLTEMDMWTLMDYCGWFDSNADTGDLDDIPDSIYEVTLQRQSFGADLGTSIKKNDPIPITTLEFPALEVPVWTGTCAPQWYFEELAQIREHNANYIAAVQAGKDTTGMMPWGISDATTQAGTYTIPADKVKGNFTLLVPDPLTLTITTYYYSYTYTIKDANGTVVATRDQVESGKDLVFTGLTPGAKYTAEMDTYVASTYGDGRQVDKTKVEETVIIDRFKLPTTREVTYNQTINIEQFDAIKNYPTFGIIDKLYYSAENNLTIERKDYDSTDYWTKEDIKALGPKIYNYWKKYVWNKSKNTFLGNTVMRDDYGIHKYIYNDIISEPIVKTTNEKDGSKTVTTTVYYLSLFDDTDTVVATLEKDAAEYVFSDLLPDTTYTVCISRRITTETYNKNDILTKHVGETKHATLEKFTTYGDATETTAYELYISVNLSFKARSVDEIAFDLLGIWPGDLLNTVQVVQETDQHNLIGKSENPEGDAYSYCLSGGTMTLIKQSGSVPSYSGYQGLKRATSSSTNTLPLTTTKWIYEYGVHPNALTTVKATPASGWKTVNANGDTLIFDIENQKEYYVYARVTVTSDTLKEDGSVVTKTNVGLYQIDKIKTVNTEVTNGTVYADGFLGNEVLRDTWEDIYTHEVDMGDYIYKKREYLTFKRMTGYQYESYVDMVMALCEYLEIPYDDWDPAVQRAKELGIDFGKDDTTTSN